MESITISRFGSHLPLATKHAVHVSREFRVRINQNDAIFINIRHTKYCGRATVSDISITIFSLVSHSLRVHLPDFRLFVSFRTVENARFTRIECRLTDRKNGSVSGPNRGVSGGALRSIEKKFFITNIFIVCIFFNRFAVNHTNETHARHNQSVEYPFTWGRN